MEPDYKLKSIAKNQGPESIDLCTIGRNRDRDRDRDRECDNCQVGRSNDASIIQEDYDL